MIIKTFRTLQDDVLRWFDEVNTSTDMRENVKQALNSAQAARLGERSWPFMLWPGKKSFPLVIGQQEYPLHLEFFRPVYFFNATDKKLLRQKTDPLGQSQDVTVTKYHFELRGTSPVAVQPPAASTLTLTSTASDGSSQKAIITGEIANGAIHQEEIVCAGSATVESFVRITRVTKIGTWSGTMILSAGATELLRLAPTELGRQYQVFFLPVAPTAADVVEYEFYRQPTIMVDDKDTPDVPSPYQDVLTFDALIDLAAYNPVESGSLKIWTAKQQRLEQGLIETYGEALSLGRQASYTPYTRGE